MDPVTCYEVARLQHAERVHRSEQRLRGEEVRRERQALPVASTTGPRRMFRMLTTRPNRA